MNEEDLEHLRDAVELSERALEHGNEPFGALLVGPDGENILEAENTQLTQNDITGHAETNLVRNAYRRFDENVLRESTLYSSCEPCPMCSGAIFWAHVGRVVYALSSETLHGIKEKGDRNHGLSCRKILAENGGSVIVEGPALEEEAARPHEAFWNS